MSLHARLERRRRWTRLAQGLLSVVIVAHVLLGAASEARETTAGRAIYDLGRPALSSLALWQNWAMFSPPPRGNAVLQAEGLTASGELIPLPLPRGQGTPDRVEVRYDRFGKLERSALKSSRARLQRSIAHWVCRQAAAAGTPVREVQLYQLKTPTAAPEQRRSSVPVTTRDEVRRVVCQ